MSSWAVSTLHRLTRELVQYRDGRLIPKDSLDAFILSLELVFRDLVAQQTYGAVDSSLQESSELVRNVLYSMTRMRDQDGLVRATASVPVIRGSGRPRFDIQYEQLAYLLDNRFTVRQIADMLSISERTVYRRMSDFSLSVRAHYANISDSHLDHLVQEVKQQFPMCGNAQMQGHLLSRGLRVQQHRVRESQRRVDPQGCVMRRLYCLNRRQYKVPAPRSLWHMDGNHKLIRYVG